MLAVTYLMVTVALQGKYACHHFVPLETEVEEHCILVQSDSLSAAYLRLLSCFPLLNI